MRRAPERLAFVAAIVVVALSAGCRGRHRTDDPVMQTESTTLPCDVESLLARRCSQCHGTSPRFGAPMSLVTSADLLAASPKDPSVRIVDRALVRLQDDRAPMPQPPNERATSAEIAALADWAARPSVRPPSTSCVGAGGGAPVDPSPECDPDVRLAPAEPWTMPDETGDTTVCFGVEIPGGDHKRHVTGFLPRLDNDKIVHHFLVFEAPSAYSPTQTECALFPAGWKLVYAWAPGASGYALPPQAGFPLEAGRDAHYVVQMHYNNYGRLPDQVDATAVDLCTTNDLRAHDADVLAFGGTGFTIPPHALHTIECSFELPEKGGSVLPVRAFQAWPHMHQLGLYQATRVRHRDGTEDQLGVADPFSFTSQLVYPAEVDLRAGDVVTTRCTWQNPGNDAVRYGEASDEEMCFNLVSYYPKISLPGFTGASPAGRARCVAVP